MSVLDGRRQRLARLVSFCGVGSVGMVIDLAITFSLLSLVSPLAANTAGFAVAVSHNFAGNWLVTFDRPNGSIPRQYLSYVAVHSLTFLVRAGVLSAVLAATGLPATVATLIGIGSAVVVNYLASERIFDGAGVADVLNDAAHVVFNSRLRGLLLWSGLYNPLFTIYGRVLAAATDSTKRMSVGGVTATVGMATPTETVSVLHTLENEREVLEQFVGDLQSGDRVLDVGANLGVYSTLAAQAGCDVVAVEPHGPTAQRCRENCPAADVHEIVLGSGVDSVGLSVEREAVGTQRGSVVGGGSIPQLPGDRLPTPDVVKIDVEGAELNVLDGLARTFAEEPPRVVYVETHSDGQREAVVERLGESDTEISVGEEETMLRVVL